MFFRVSSKNSHPGIFHCTFLTRKVNSVIFVKDSNPGSHFKINQSIIPSTDVIQLTLTLKMTTAQVVETSVTVNNNSPIQDYVHQDDQTQPTVIFIIIGAG